jgi:pimeloyl-ACP methyl ester carboxylesterase
MFKKTLISLAVASSLGLTGCFDSAGTGANANPEYSISNPAFDGKTWPLFNPVTGELPLPNDLIFQKDDVETVGVNEADGTFDVDDTKPPVTTAINRLSGASTVAPIDIALNREIPESSVDGLPFLVNPEDGELVLKSGIPVPNPEQNVFLIELDYASGDPLQALSLSEPPTVPLAQPFAQILATIKGGGTPSAALVTAARTAAQAAVDQYKVSVIKQSGKSVIRINLLKPLNSKKRYIVVVTNGVKDSLGEPIIPSPTYSSITDPKAPLGTDELLPVRKIVNALWETVAEGYFALPNSTRTAQSLPNISADNIAVSYSFMTSGDEKILPYMAQPKDWFTDQVRALVRLGAVRKVAGAATVLSAVQSAVQDGASPEVALQNALAAMRKSDDEVGANDTNGNGEIDPLDFDFNGDNDLTSADFNLSSTGDTPESPFNYFDVQAAIGAAEARFPPISLKAALPLLFGSGGACASMNFKNGTTCAGTALAAQFDANLPQIGDKSDSIILPPFTDPSAAIAALLTPALSSVPGSDTAVVLQGSIELPYYLGTPVGEDGSAINDDVWTADHPLADKLNTAFGPVGLQLAQGVKSPITSDYASDAVNYLFPFPERNRASDQKIPMLVMVPKPGTATASGFTWNGTDKLPVVVFQHGITTDRSAALSVGSALTSAGFGVVAIDLPLHGIDAQDQSDKTSGVAQEKAVLATALLKGLDAKNAASSGPLPTQNTPANVNALIDQTFVTQSVGFVQAALGCTESDPIKIAAGKCTTSPSAGTAPAAQYVGFALGAQNSVKNYTSVIPGIARTEYERHFNFTANASGTPIPMNFDAGVGSSGSLYINLQNFINSRDKNLQSQIDLVNVVASVGGIDVNGDSVGDFDTNKIYMIGHSLGTVAAAGATAVANQTDITDVQATALLAPASGITRLLENSPSFAPRILQGLQAKKC